MARRLIRLPLLLAATIVGCREATSLTSVPCPGDTVTLSVSATTGPDFSWSPACLMGIVQVDNADQLLWRLQAADSNGVPSPVRYGVVPSGKMIAGTAGALVRGTTYAVSVWRWIDGAGAYVESGRATFTY